MKQGIIILYRETILEHLHSYHFQCYVKKAIASYNNAYTCNRFFPLGYFIVYRLSSSMQPTADFPHSKSNLLWGNLTGRCELRAGQTAARPWCLRLLWTSEQAETEITGALAWSRNYYSQYCCSE